MTKRVVHAELVKILLGHTEERYPDLIVPIAFTVGTLGLMEAAEYLVVWKEPTAAEEET